MDNFEYFQAKFSTLEEQMDATEYQLRSMIGDLRGELATLSTQIEELQMNQRDMFNIIAQIAGTSGVYSAQLVDMLAALHKRINNGQAR